ncbi:HD-GYP domain-containing protein [Pelagibaculum spongiae]|uniref:Metal-dependent phosphohydrolase n=1 Tax=Pelagibaculum spongiae TaxID=2080658 RepID=A0A2V1GVL9_9GAMM|nr:HD domain-containing phosphohydrolase [Pelagibaculum spongiae]PVZ63861.1 hypothetical protein DC094_20245 [Pelagibaculum spongiae]
MTVKRTLIHYLLALILFSVYAVQVCPFLESLSYLELIAPFLGVFVLQFFARQLLERKISASDFKHQVAKQFRYDFLLFLASSLFLGNYFAMLYNSFPYESYFKIVIGLNVFGFFIAGDLALNRERFVARKLRESGQHIQPDNNPFPLTKKFSWFAIASALAVTGVVFLVINKDLSWLVQVGDQLSLKTAQHLILAEIAFVVVVILGYMLLIIFGYAKNLSNFIDAENQVLSKVTRGDMSGEVPVTSNDEFGLMAMHTNNMIGALDQQSRELRLTRDASILSLASLAETRDNETGSHILRTQHYVKALAEYLGQTAAYSDQLDSATIEMLFKSAPLHDVGKVGIPDHILLKPGKLTVEEYELMKKHPQIGADALSVAEHQLGSNSFLRLAREISLTHHEKWDGSGYPNELVGENIPLSGRLMALADVYDALISSRVYKPGMSHEKAKAIILTGRGKHFDPTIVDAFIALESAFVAIAAKFTDSPTFRSNAA